VGSRMVDSCDVVKRIQPGKWAGRAPPNCCGATLHRMGQSGGLQVAGHEGDTRGIRRGRGVPGIRAMGRVIVCGGGRAG
jgi:hypothetical protein